MPFYKDTPSKKNKPKTNYGNTGSWADEGAHYSDAKKPSPSNRRFGPGAASPAGDARPARGPYGKRPGAPREDARPAGAGANQRFAKPTGERSGYQGKPRYGRPAEGGVSQDKPRYGRPAEGGVSQDKPRYGRPAEGGVSQDKPRYGRPAEGPRPAFRSGERFPRPVRPIAPKPDTRKEYEKFQRPAAPRAVEVVKAEESIENENLLSGRNPIREALKSGRDIEKMLVAKGELSGSAKEIIMMAKERHIPVQEVERVRLDEITRNHQGMLAFASAYHYATVEGMLETAKERNEEPFLVILDGITDPHNLGAIIRSAECVGVHGVIVPMRRSVGLTPAAVKASAGAVEHVKVARVTNLTQTIEKLRENGLWFYAADMEGESYDKVDYKGGACLVIGAEGEGISRLVLENCDKRISIPVKGQIDSLNASVAAGVLLYNMMQSRAK